MNKYLLILKCFCFTIPCLYGCSASLDQRVNKTDGVDSRLLEKRIDDLSSAMTFIVNDSNRLHNEMEEVKTSSKTIQQKIERLEATVSNLDKQIITLNTLEKTQDVVQPSANEEDVHSLLPNTDNNISPDKQESDIQKTVNVENPLDIAKEFWNATNTKDIQAVQLYVTKESAAKLQIQDTDVTTNSEVTFGDVNIEDNKTTINTTMHTREGTTEFEIQLQTILIKEDGQWKVDTDQTMLSMFGGAMGEMIKGLGKAMEEGLTNGLKEIGATVAESMPKEVEELPQTGESKTDIITPGEETAATSKESTLPMVEGVQADFRETRQTSEAKHNITPPQQESIVTSEISENTKRELFLRDNIARLTEAEFPDNKGTQWHILSLDHKAQVTHVEVEPTPATLDYPRYKLIVSFKDPVAPRVIGTFCFKDGQYILFSAKKK